MEIHCFSLAEGIVLTFNLQQYPTFVAWQPGLGERGELGHTSSGLARMCVAAQLR